MIEIQILSDKTVRMCMLAWSFAARICDKYLNHITGLSLHLYPLFLV